MNPGIVNAPSILGNINDAQVAAGRDRLEAALGATKPSDADSIDKTSKDFEAVFITQMLNQMFQDVGKDGLFYGGNAEDMWRGMLMNEYGKVLTSAGGIGIADHVKTELLRLQEVHNG